MAWAAQAGWWCRGVCNLTFWLGPDGLWVWALALDLCYFLILISCFLILYLVRCGLMPVISLYHYWVGRRGFCPGMHTQCALSGLTRQQAICMIKWTQSPSGRMKRSVARFTSMRQHSGKAVLFVMMFFCDRVIFPVCHRYVKANRVAIGALFANWCLLEYIDFVGAFGIISRDSLDIYCNLGFKLHVPPPLFCSFINQGLRAAAPAPFQKKKLAYLLEIRNQVQTYDT
ncbi:hypothetical protein RchiOBHm_Chr4g0427731 [Rosa chinensis]|uniref:Uncharacterized protein n=1 Tax=Rosa chinensis TaxID=74649 RepID=A0A2P6QZQ0_ROSCH|nr:hypothetical protein RchiOBHm_Chr4g0427731 [Rosa chinensis]